MRPSRSRRAVVSVVIGAAAVLAAVLGVFWWAAREGPDRPVASPPPRPAPSGTSVSGPSTTPVPRAPGPSRTWAVPLEAGRDGRGPALVAAQFLERAVTLGTADRARWARAAAAPGRGAAAAGFVDRWVDGLVDGRDVRPDPQSGSETGVTLRTLGARVLQAADDPARAKVILWQRVTVEGDPVTSAYLLAFVTVVPTGDGPLLDAVDGVRPGPAPDPGTAMVYPPIEP